MRARLVVFPVKGRNWCFSRSLEQSTATAPVLGSAQASYPPVGLGDLWRRLRGEGRSGQEQLELTVDFIGNKMNLAWLNLEKAPAGSLKKKIHGLGLKLLSRVKPSEIFLKSVSKDITKVDITFPSRLNPRLVRRRLRHVALRGYAHHQIYFYGSIFLIPISATLSVLPLPNVPFFWVLFRAYSNWRALKGSERLLMLVSDCSSKWKSLESSENEESVGDSKNAKERNDESQAVNGLNSPWVLQPSEELDKLLFAKSSENGINSCTISDICRRYHLNETDVLKFRESM